MRQLGAGEVWGLGFRPLQGFLAVGESKRNVKWELGSYGDCRDCRILQLGV